MYVRLYTCFFCYNVTDHLFSSFNTYVEGENEIQVKMIFT